MVDREKKIEKRLHYEHFAFYHRPVGEGRVRPLCRQMRECSSLEEESEDAC